MFLVCSLLNSTENLQIVSVTSIIGLLCCLLSAISGASNLELDPTFCVPIPVISLCEIIALELSTSIRLLVTVVSLGNGRFQLTDFG